MPIWNGTADFINSPLGLVFFLFVQCESALWIISIAGLGFGFGLGHGYLYYAGYFHWFRLRL